ncbi:flagellar hook-basal body complex protein FliE [Lacibacterium aquatile]|uniref:Flagellar hook-basal body complex protein FliE n=1 Tax=Lacibacterium aquatile TaxID=1168082 RepID=A0ABW5DN62_9PROT
MANPISPANVAAAYGGAARAIIPAGDTQPSAGPAFSTLVEQVAKNTVDAQHNAEAQTMRAVAGQAKDLTEVVTAVTHAELALQTVVSVRDRVVAAYQEIMRMPI